MPIYFVKTINYIKSLIDLYHEIFTKDQSPFDGNKFYMNSPKGWDRLRSYFWTKHVDVGNLDYYRNYFGKATVKGRLWRAIAFPPQMRPFYDLFDFYMKPKHIKFLQSLRNKNTKCSCRITATRFAQEFPETNIEPNDSYDGRWLYLYAFDLTGDKNLEV